MTPCVQGACHVINTQSILAPSSPSSHSEEVGRGKGVEVGVRLRLKSGCHAGRFIFIRAGLNVLGWGKWMLAQRAFLAVVHEAPSPGTWG